MSEDGHVKQRDKCDNEKPMGNIHRLEKEKENLEVLKNKKYL